MKTRSFGRSGLSVTELCLGTMTFGGQADEAAAFEILDQAWHGGIRFIDTADVYPVPMTLDRYGVTETIIGRWLHRRGRRNRVVLATKGYFPAGPLPHERGNSRRHLLEACEGSLRRLQTDRIDLYLCHGWDPGVPIEETLETLEELRTAGKILHAGISNVRAHEVTEALLAAQRLGITGLAGLQPRYSVIYREAEESLLPLARQAGLGVMVYNPLAGGLLSGRYPEGAEPGAGRFTLGDTGATYRRRYWNEPNLAAARRAAELAIAAGLSPVTTAIAWVLGRPDISSAIVGASEPGQVRANLDAAKTSLPTDLVSALDRIWYDLPRVPPSLDSPRL